MKLTDQIREYAALVDAEQTPISVEEIVARRDDLAVVRTLPRPRATTQSGGLWIAAAAAVVTIVLIGAAALLLRGSSSVPPADTVPDPIPPLTDSLFAPVETPTGFVLQSVEFNQQEDDSHFVYLRDTGSQRWVPSAGGFSVDARPRLLAADGDGASGNAVVAARARLEAALDTAGAEAVEIAGQEAVLLETTFEQSDVSATHLSLLVHDGSGGMFEVTAVGLSREEVVELGASIGRVDAEELEEQALALPWSHRAVVFHRDFVYEVPPQLESVMAAGSRVVLGVDLFTPRLLSGGAATRSNLGHVYVAADGRDAGSVAATLAGAAGVLSVVQSPALARAHVKMLVTVAESGPILGEDPLVRQAAMSAEPGFDASELGVEVPLVPLTAAPSLPDWILAEDDPARYRPGPTGIVVIGRVVAPGATDDPLLLSWITGTDEWCRATVFATSGGTGCTPVGPFQYGVVGELTGEGDALTYVVSLNTAVVQFVTRDGSFWQQPVAGLGLFPHGNGVLRPVELIALDATGGEIGRWTVSDG